MGIFIDQKFKHESWDEIESAEREVRNGGYESVKNMNTEALQSSRRYFQQLTKNVNKELKRRSEK